MICPMGHGEQATIGSASDGVWRRPQLACGCHPTHSASSATDRQLFTVARLPDEIIPRSILEEVAQQDELALEKRVREITLKVIAEAKLDGVDLTTEMAKVLSISTDPIL